MVCTWRSRQTAIWRLVYAWFFKLKKWWFSVRKMWFVVDLGWQPWYVCWLLLVCCPSWQSPIWLLLIFTLTTHDVGHLAGITCYHHQPTNAEGHNLFLPIQFLGIRTGVPTRSAWSTSVCRYCGIILGYGMITIKWRERCGFNANHMSVSQCESHVTFPLGTHGTFEEFDHISTIEIPIHATDVLSIGR